MSSLSSRFLTILALFVSFLVFAVAGEDADGIIQYSHSSNVGPLNPHLYSPNQMFAQEMIYEPLVQLGENGEIEPCLAERWEISDDGLVYTFHLRSGVVFSDGIPFDAEAVAGNFHHIMANRQRHTWLDLTNRIADFQAVAPMTFKLVLDSPYYPTLEDLSLPRPFRFLSPAAFPDSGTTRDGIKRPIGTGPWKLAETRLGEYDSFKRNEKYWGKRPKASGVMVKVIPDPMSRAIALETDEIDLIYGQGQVSYDTFNALRHNPVYETHISRPVGSVVLAINSKRPPTDDLSVRRALQHLADKDALVRGVFLGTQPRANTLFSPDIAYCDIGLEPYAYDTEKATVLLEAAGWKREGSGGVRSRDGIPLRIDMCFAGNNAAQKAIAEVLQSQAAKLGVQLNLVGEEEDSFFRRQKDGNFGIIVNTTWGPPFEPHAMLGSMRRPSHADYQAQSGLAMKEEIDAGIGRVLQTTDEDERRELYREILTTLHEQAVYIPIHYNTLLAVFKKGKVSDFRFGPGKSKIPFENYGKIR